MADQMIFQENITKMDIHRIRCTSPMVGNNIVWANDCLFVANSINNPELKLNPNCLVILDLMLHGY
jgi:hypothetical protein